MVNRFSQMIESSGDVTDRKPAGRQMSLFTEFSTINETSNGSDSKFNSGDSGYGDDSFRRRSRSVNTITAITNASKVVLSKYEKHPNFKFSYLKYFGVEPTEYLSTFGIEYDSVSDTVFNLSDRKANGSDTVTNDIEFSIKRKRSHTVSSKKTFDSTVVKVSKLNYFAAETVDVTLGENVPMKVATSIECTDLEDVFTTKVVASREVFLEKSLRSVATQTCEPELETVDSDDVPLHVKISPERESKISMKTVVDDDLKARIQQSINSYDDMMKSLRNGGIRKKRRTGFEAK